MGMLKSTYGKLGKLNRAVGARSRQWWKRFKNLWLRRNLGKPFLQYLETNRRAQALCLTQAVSLQSHSSPLPHWSLHTYLAWILRQVACTLRPTRDPCLMTAVDATEVNRIRSMMARGMKLLFPLLCTSKARHLCQHSGDPQSVVRPANRNHKQPAIPQQCQPLHRHQYPRTFLRSLKILTNSAMTWILQRKIWMS